MPRSSAKEAPTEPSEPKEDPKEEDPTEPSEPKEEPKEEEPTEPEKPVIKWVRPVSSYKLTSPFGMRIHPVYGDERMHNGIDMSCAEGTPIYATREK